MGGVNCQCVFVCVKGATRETQNSPLKKRSGGIEMSEWREGGKGRSLECIVEEEPIMTLFLNSVEAASVFVCVSECLFVCLWVGARGRGRFLVLHQF